MTSVENGGGLDKDTEEFLLQESKKVLQDVTGEEFILFMKILSGGVSMQIWRRLTTGEIEL